MSKANLALVLGNWQGETGPRYHKLALSITRANERGDLLTGDQLPPERELAAALGISRSTVVSAYALLREWKVAQSRRVGGTYIHSSTASKHRSPERFAIQRAHSKTDRVVLAGYLSPGFARVKRALAEVCDADSEIPYGVDAINHPGFQRAVAGYYADAGVPTFPEHLTATTGVMQGMNIVIAELVQPGDRVLVATPTLMGVGDGLRRAGASLVHAQPGSDRWHRMLE